MKRQRPPSTPPSKPQSRPGVVRRVGVVFLIGWLMSFLLFGLEAPGRALVSPVWPILFCAQSMNGDYGMVLVCFGVVLLAGGLAVFSVIRLKLVWL